MPKSLASKTAHLRAEICHLHGHRYADQNTQQHAAEHLQGRMADKLFQLNLIHFFIRDAVTVYIGVLILNLQLRYLLSSLA